MLATLLGRPETQRETLEHSLSVFDEIRRPFSQHIQDMSLEFGKTVRLGSSRMQAYSVEDSSAGRIPHDELMELMDEDVKALTRWTWTTTITEDLQLGVDKLKAKVTSSSV
jgi:hypothetical protein